MILSKLADLIKRFDVLLVSIVVLAIVIYFNRDTPVTPDLPLGYGLIVYLGVWSVFALIRRTNGKRWNY